MAATSQEKSEYKGIETQDHCVNCWICHCKGLGYMFGRRMLGVEEASDCWTVEGLCTGIHRCHHLRYCQNWKYTSLLYHGWTLLAVTHGLLHRPRSILLSSKTFSHKHSEIYSRDFPAELPLLFCSLFPDLPISTIQMTCETSQLIT